MPPHTCAWLNPFQMYIYVASFITKQTSPPPRNHNRRPPAADKKTLTPRQLRLHVIRDTRAARTLAKNRHARCIAAKLCDIIAHPFQHHHLVLQAEIAGRLGALRAEEAERPEAEIRAHINDITVEQMIGPIEHADAGAAHKAAAMEEHHHRQRALGFRSQRCVDIQIQTVLAAIDGLVPAIRIALNADGRITDGLQFRAPGQCPNGWLAST